MKVTIKILQSSKVSSSSQEVQSL